MKTAKAMAERAANAAGAAGAPGGDGRRAAALSTSRVDANGAGRVVPIALGAAALALGGGLLYRNIQGRRDGATPPKAPEVERSITIGASPAELYRAWREPATLTRVMGHVAEVTAANADQMHWSASAPFGRRLEWDARVVEDDSDELLHWESLAGATVPNTGTVRFRPAPGNRGTEVALRIRVDPPGGALGAAAAARLGIVPGLLADKTLRRFKSLVETGEIPTLAHNPSARDE